MIMATAAQADATGEWEALAKSVQLHQDPGAAVALVEAVAEGVACFGSLGRDAQGPAHQLHLVAAAVMDNPVGADRKLTSKAAQCRLKTDQGERPTLPQFVAGVLDGDHHGLEGQDPRAARARGQVDQ